MNSKVIKTMIVLCWVFLGVFAILKLFWADKFAIAVNNQQIIEVGTFIDNRVWLKQILHVFTTCLTYHFYLCACCHRWHLSVKEYIVCALFVIPNVYLCWYVYSVGTLISFLLMFALPFFLKADYRTVLIIFSTHTLGQIAISFIRSQPMNLVSLNTVSQILMSIDMYIWLLLYYLYSNLYKEKKFMGSLAPPVWGRMTKQIEAEIAKLDKQIAECADETKLAKLHDKKAEYEEMLANSSDEK